MLGWMVGLEKVNDCFERLVQLTRWQNEFPLTSAAFTVAPFAMLAHEPF